MKRTRLTLYSLILFCLTVALACRFTAASQMEIRPVIHIMAPTDDGGEYLVRVHPDMIRYNSEGEYFYIISGGSELRISEKGQ